VCTERRPSQTVEASQSPVDLSGLLDLVRADGRVVVQRLGEPVAVLISIDEYRRLTKAEVRRDLFAAIDEVQEAFSDVPLDEIEREVTRAIAEARRAERNASVDARPA